MREGLLAFATNLRANAKEAEKFSAEHVATSLGKQATKNAETHFATRTNRLAHELRARDSEFASLVACCLTRDPCRHIIDTLVEAGLQDLIQQLGTAVDAIARRACYVLDGESRKQLDEDLAHVHRMVASLAEVASWIASKARMIGDEDVPPTARCVELAEPLRGLVQSSSTKAKAFLLFLAEQPPAFRRSDHETTLAFLKRVRDEKRRIENETKAFVTSLSVFTNAHVGAAEAVGGGAILRFLEKREELVQQIAAIRNTSILLTQSVIDRVIRGISLRDEDGDGSGGEQGGLDAASGIIFWLDSVHKQLDEQKRLLGGVSHIVTAARMAATAKQADLPAWEEIHGTGKRTDTGQKAIWMLVLAFQDPDKAKQAFTSATAKELLGRLNALPIARGARFSDSWVLRALKKAKELGVVFTHPRAEGQSKTIPDRHQLCDAAIRKYSGKLAAR